jgi:site-specific recombinase XerD
MSFARFARISRKNKRRLTVGSLLAGAGEEAEIGFKVHPHMLRHACGYALTNKGLDTRTLQAYLGHRSINSTTRYAALALAGSKTSGGRCRGMGAMHYRR